MASGALWLTMNCRRWLRRGPMESLCRICDAAFLVGNKMKPDSTAYPPRGLSREEAARYVGVSLNAGTASTAPCAWHRSGASHELQSPCWRSCRGTGVLLHASSGAGHRRRHAQAGRRYLPAMGNRRTRGQAGCWDGWPAGSLATIRLQALTAGRSVVCQEKDRDRYGRIVAICRASGEDLGAIMVREGLAWAFVRYSRDYVEQYSKAASKTHRQRKSQFTRGN